MCTGPGWLWEAVQKRVTLHVLGSPWVSQCCLHLLACPSRPQWIWRRRRRALSESHRQATVFVKRQEAGLGQAPWEDTKDNVAIGVAHTSRLHIDRTRELSFRHTHTHKRHYSARYKLKESTYTHVKVCLQCCSDKLLNGPSERGTMGTSSTHSPQLPGHAGCCFRDSIIHELHSNGRLDSML